MSSQQGNGIKYNLQPPYCTSRYLKHYDIPIGTIRISVLRSCKHTSCHVRHRLYKVMWTQPLPLLCLAETESSRCGLVFASCRKLNREVCQRQQEERLMEHLTQRRSQFELSHILMTQLEAWHHGCWANTVNAFTWHSNKTAQQKCI